MVTLLALNPWGVNTNGGNGDNTNGSMRTGGTAAVGREGREGVEGGSQQLHVLRVADLVAFCRLRGVPQVLPLAGGAMSMSNGTKTHVGRGNGGSGASLSAPSSSSSLSSFTTSSSAPSSSSSSLFCGNSLEVHQRSLRTNTDVYVKELDKLDPFIKRHSEDGTS